MIPFNVSQKSMLLLDQNTGFANMLAREFQETKDRSALGAFAHSLLREAIQCILVCFNEPATRLLHKAHAWVLEAIAVEEKPMHYFPSATEAERFETLALCNWLLHGQHDQTSLDNYVKYYGEYLTSKGTKADKVGVSMALSSYADARAFQRVLDIFEKIPKLSPPESLSKVRNEGQMVYVLAQHHVHGKFSRDEVADAGEKFLKRNIEQFLGNGRYIDAVQWLKILHWNDTDRTVSPKDIVMKCYDYLPGRTPPA
jgi:hypothetical protein